MLASQSILSTSHVTQSPGNIVSNMDGEKVLLNIEKGKYFNLGEIGGRIWECIETPTSVRAIVDTLLSEYDVEEAVCMEQVTVFLHQLLKEDLISIN